jgi:RNA polymerase sigma factor (sigma-70 family)
MAATPLGSADARVTLEGLYEQHATELADFFKRRTNDADAAADLVGATFATAYQRREHFRGDSPTHALRWLFDIAADELQEFLRGSLAGREVGYGLKPPELWPADQKSLEAIAEVRELERRLSEQVAGLPEREKLVIALHAYEDLSFAAVGRELGISATTASRSYARALVQLAQLRELEELAGGARTTLLRPDGTPADPASAETREFEIRVAEVSDELIQALMANPDLLYELAPRRFEELVAELYDRRGFEVVLTPPTGDDGVDVYVVRHDELGSSLTVVQCKRYAARNKIGAALVRELQGSVSALRASAGVLLTTSFFTKGARRIEEQFKYQLTLHDYFDLLELLKLPPRTR